MQLDNKYFDKVDPYRPPEGIPIPKRLYQWWFYSFSINMLEISERWITGILTIALYTFLFAQLYAVGQWASNSLF